MKRVLLFAVLGGLALASAAQDQSSSSVEVRGSQITIPARAYPIFPSDLMQYTGTYEMSNGDVMRLRRWGRILYAEVGDQAPKKLIPASPNEFVAIDRQLRITLTPDDYGGMTGELLMVVPRLVSSTGSGDETRLLSFR